MVNILSEGDRILMFETGHFSTLWKTMAEKLGFTVDYINGDWRSGVDAEKIADVIKKDKDHNIKAICMVHNET